MKTILVAAALFGCDCGGSACVVVDQPPQTWQTVEECDRAIAGQLERATMYDYPTLKAVCHVVVEPQERPFGSPAARMAAQTPALQGDSVAAGPSEAVPEAGREAPMERASAGYGEARKVVVRTIDRTGTLARDGALWVRRQIGI